MSEDYINLKMGDRISFLDDDTGEIFKAVIFDINVLVRPEIGAARIEIIANKDDGGLCVILDD